MICSKKITVSKIFQQNYYLYFHTITLLKQKKSTFFQKKSYKKQ
jgi:hypothetical protein